MSMDAFSADDAIILGCDYLARLAEALLHNEDRMAIEDEVADQLGSEFERYRGGVFFEEMVHNTRLEIEAALIGATRGNFVEVKRYLHKLSEGWSHWGSTKNLSNQLTLLNQKIPTHHHPYTLPMPASLDA